MPESHKGRVQSERSMMGGPRNRRRAHGRRRLWARSIAVLVPLALVLVASLAPIGQAQTVSEQTPEEESLVAAKRVEREERKQAEREERKRAEQHEREERVASRKAARQPSKRATLHPVPNQRERQQAVVTFDCGDVKLDWRGFRAGPDPYNTVSELVTIDHGDGTHTEFTFAGTSASNTVTFLLLAPGGYVIDVQGHWRHSTANGLSGGFDMHAPVKCAPTPMFTIEKLQQLEGSGSFTKSTLTGGVGQTVDYEIVVTNTGNVALTLSSFTDPHCEAGTISGPEPGATVEAHASAKYTCKHVLTLADRVAGSYSNEASVTGTPPDGDGTPITHPSNVVTVEVPPPTPALSIEKLQKIAGGSSPYTTSTLTGGVGQTVDYEILVKNTGNVALTLASPTDAGCDAGTITGGPIGGLLAAGASTSYTCTHVLSATDQSAGSHANVVTLIATPNEGEESPVTSTSNTVLTDVPPPSPPTGQAHEPTTGGPKTSPSSPGSSGVLPSTISQSGVLAFSSATIPALKGPEGCVRASFHVSIKSAGVASVTFYMDGHKLKTLTAKNAHKGLLTIQISVAKLTLGSHKLVAKITTTHTASTKAKQGSRSIMVLRCRSAVVTPRFTG
jgi:hypothetical protein